MKQRFWFPAIRSDHDARIAAVWSCFGYVWIGGGQMLLALLNSAGWVKIADQTPEMGIFAAIYAAVFGWLTWKQSLAGTIIGFTLWVFLTGTIALLSVRQGDFAAPLRGWWAIIGQAMLLLNGIRAARYRRGVGKSIGSSSSSVSSSAMRVAVGSANKAPPAVEPSPSSKKRGIKYCRDCAMNVLPLEGGACPACRRSLI
jgi:hypothetical protein